MAALVRGSDVKGICSLPEGAVRSVIDLSLPEVSGLETETQKIESFLEKDKEDGGSAAEVWPELIADALPQLRGYSLLQMLTILVAVAMQNRNGSTVLWQLIEYFAGAAKLTKAHIELGIGRSSRWDKDYGEHHDCLTTVGLAHWLCDLLLAGPKALIWFGTQCSSFVLMCKSVSKRNASNGWLGDTGKNFVKAGNKQMHITSLMYLLSWLIGCCPVLEQPVSSVLPKINPLSTVLRFTQAKRTVTWMGSFKGGSPKPLQLFHTAAAYEKLKRPCPALKFRKDILVKRASHADGKVTFRGAKGLKASQEYTAEFGRAVAVIAKGQFP